MHLSGTMQCEVQTRMKRRDGDQKESREFEVSQGKPTVVRQLAMSHCFAPWAAMRRIGRIVEGGGGGGLGGGGGGPRPLGANPPPKLPLRLPEIPRSFLPGRAGTLVYLTTR